MYRGAIRCSRAEKLQWGRDQLIAEMLHKTVELQRRIELQWGRDQLIAEMAGAGRGRGGGSGFNGAAIS